MKAKNISISAIFFCLLCLEVSEEAKILGIFPIAAKSHYYQARTLMQGLAEAGHDVTLVNPYNETFNTKTGSYRTVLLTGFEEAFKKVINDYNPFENPTTNSFTYMLGHQNAMYIFMESIFIHPNVKELLQSNETFDVVIVEQISTEALKYFAYHFKAHLVTITYLPAESKLNYVVGNPTMVSYFPQSDTDFPRNMTLNQRIYNFLHYIFEAAVFQYHWLPTQDKLIKKHFPEAPSIFDINYNVSLCLVNSHESIQQSTPLVPNIIPIGGFQAKKPKSLPKDLQEYLDKATEGVIYVSLGATIQTKNLPLDKKEALLKTFGSIKKKILWKWEGENIPNLPSNVMKRKWFPQMEILAHPNVKLFITQGGLLSLTEAVYVGMPLLVLPIFADQEINAQYVIFDEYGLSISFHNPNFSKEKLVSMIEEILSNPKFKENALKISRIFHDRDIQPLQKAIYWIEYIIRHNGAPHLRVFGINLAWYQHYSLDVLSILILGVIIILAFSYSVIRYLLGCFSRKEKSIYKNKVKKS